MYPGVPHTATITPASNIPSGVAVDDAGSEDEGRGACTKCGKPVLVTQEREKSPTGKYYHIDCRAMVAGSSVKRSTKNANV